MNFVNMKEINRSFFSHTMTINGVQGCFEPLYGQKHSLQYILLCFSEKCHTDSGLLIDHIIFIFGE